MKRTFGYQKHGQEKRPARHSPVPMLCLLCGTLGSHTFLSLCNQVRSQDCVLPNRMCTAQYNGMQLQAWFLKPLVQLSPATTCKQLQWRALRPQEVTESQIEGTLSAEYTLLSSSCETFTRIDHILCHKHTSTNFKEQIVYNVCSQTSVELN